MRRAALLLLSLVSTACAARQPRDLIPDASAFTARCRFGATQTSLLVTEWSVSDKADLEALMSEGRGVAVAFSGCRMKVLPQCRIQGSYAWQQTTPGSDFIEIKNEAELYAKLPLGALSLSGELKQSGNLTVETTVAGQKRLTGVASIEVPSADAACAEATHIVNAISLGAFVLSAGGEESANASMDITKVGSATGKGSRSAKVVRWAGDAKTCYSTNPEAPPAGCASPIQVFLSPIPGRAEAMGPPGTVKVDFVSDTASSRWDVYVDDQATCTTPCSRWVDPTRPLVLRVRDSTEKVRVGALHRDVGPVQIAASPRAMGPWVTGLTFTALGGMGVVTGITLLGVGCSDDDRETMCDAGVITFGVSAVVTAAAIWLMLDSGAKVRVRPVFEGTF